MKTVSWIYFLAAEEVPSAATSQVVLKLRWHELTRLQAFCRRVLHLKMCFHKWDWYDIGQGHFLPPTSPSSGTFHWHFISLSFFRYQ